jgi:uncharacterized protein (TIGR02145 family)
MGWHVPTDREWAVLSDKVEGNGDGSTFSSQTATGWMGTDAGKKLKSSGTFTGTDPGDGSWRENANRGTDESGFGAAPAGHRHGSGMQFYNRGIYVYYWSSSVESTVSAWSRQFFSGNALVFRNYRSRSDGFSVRCVKN